MLEENRGLNNSKPSSTVSFPRQHLLLAAILAALLAALLSLSSGSVEANRNIRKEVPLALALETPPEYTVVTPKTETWSNYGVRPGDNLSKIFQRAGLNDADVHDVLSKAEGGKELTRIFPGQTVSFRFADDDEGELSALRYQVSPLVAHIYRKTEQGYERESIIKEPEHRRSFASATINSSLFMAGQDAGMSQTTIMELANIFGGVIDFVLDPRKGDLIHVLYEELYLDGEKLGDGEILAAEFVNKGKSYTAFRYVDEDDRAGYFSEDGVSMRKAFLLAPLDFTRVSSNFNLRRLHPIYKTTRPHRGTDYAAARGTPVFAAGDGRVVEAGYTRANGNYVVVQHGEQYTTKYLHLHKRKVAKGNRVSQQQVIGTVGSTGAATGPHLHYEFLLNGVHRNPRTIHKKLPKARSLAAAEMPRFLEQTRGHSMQLGSLRQKPLQLAQASKPAKPTGSL